MYGDEAVPEYVDESLCQSALSILDELASALEVPVLLSSVELAPFCGLVDDVADRELSSRDTGLGSYFEGDGYETRIYWDQGAWQTTIPY